MLKVSVCEKASDCTRRWLTSSFARRCEEVNERKRSRSDWEACKVPGKKKQLLSNNKKNECVLPVKVLKKKSECKTLIFCHSNAIFPARGTFNYQLPEFRALAQQSRHPWHLKIWIVDSSAGSSSGNRWLRSAEMFPRFVAARWRHAEQQNQVQELSSFACCSARKQAETGRCLFSRPVPSRLELFCTSRPNGVLVCLEKCDALSVWAVTLVFKQRYAFPCLAWAWLNNPTYVDKLLQDWKRDC